MAEQNDPVSHGELVEIVRRLDDRISSMDRNIDDRISSMDRNIDDRISSMDRNMSEMRADIRMLARFVMGSYAVMIGVAGALFTLYKMFPNP